MLVNNNPTVFNQNNDVSLENKDGINTIIDKKIVCIAITAFTLLSLCCATQEDYLSPYSIAIASGICLISLCALKLLFDLKSTNNKQIEPAQMTEKKIQQLLEESQFDLYDSMIRDVQRSNQKGCLAEYYPPQKPSASYAPNREKALDWINRHPEELQDLATQFIDRIQHVSQANFENHLKNSVDDFNNYLSQLPRNQRNYSIVLPLACNRTGKTFTNMSNLWVTLIALRFFKTSPKKIMVVNNCRRENIVDWKKENIQHVVYFDDAAYSGRQVSEMVESLKIDKKIKMHLIIPFIGKLAKTNIEKAFTVSLQRTPHQYRIAQHQMMPAFYDFLSDEDKNIMNDLFKAHPRPQTLGLTYFDHKIADTWSVFNSQLNGESLLSKGKGTKYIDDVPPPYKQRRIKKYN